MKASCVSFRISAVIICLLSLASCTKDLTGRIIRFSASTRPDASTKTVYSGDVVGGRERIDWSANDKIILAMKNDGGLATPLVYEVNDISTVGVNSKTGLDAEDTSASMEWGTGTHDFWAGYPSTVTVGDHTLSAAIPANQVATYDQKKDNVLLFKPDMNLAFMVAGLQSVPTDAGINLDFYPGFTTFDFTVGANADVTIERFVMETEKYEEETAMIVPLSGTAVATFDPASDMSYSFSTTGTTSQTIELTFNDGKGGSTTYNPIMSTSTSMNFKVFALPQDLPGIRITFFFAGGTQKSLRLKQNDSWITFPAGVKANITGLLVPGATWYINFDYPRQEQWIVHPDIEIGVE